MAILNAWDENTAEFLKAAVADGATLAANGNSMQVLGKKYGYDIDPIFGNQLQSLEAIQNVPEVSEAVDKDVVDFVSAVVNDGRYINDLCSDPHSVAEKLTFNLPEKCTNYIGDLGQLADIEKITADINDPKAASAIVAIVIVGVVALGPKRAGAGPVFDADTLSKI